MKLHILRNISLEPVAPMLRQKMQDIGHDVDISFGQFDSVLQDAEKIAELALTSNDVVVVCLYLKKLTPELFCIESYYEQKSLAKFINQTLEYVVTVLNMLRTNTPAKILVHNFELELYPEFGYADAQLPNGQNHSIIELNEAVRASIVNTPNCWLVDTNNILLELGHGQYYDHRYWFSSQLPYGAKALEKLSETYSTMIGLFIGKRKKCIVVDCDNTLWGGVVGEDGLKGIKLSPNGIGAAYKSFQQTLLGLTRRDIILCLCSKNNESDVWEVFSKHPHMVLERKDIVAAKINWENKASNIMALADELNIGLDSIVFVDDSPIEIDYVSKALPQVTCIKVSPKTPSISHQLIKQFKGFQQLDADLTVKSVESKFANQSLRNKIQQNLSVADFITTLNIVLTIQSQQIDIARVAEMSQKTNQFNLTTRRYSKDDIQSFIDSKNYTVLTIALNDKYGDMGVIGYSIFELKPETSVIEINSFALSCRALGRGVEFALLQEIWQFGIENNFKSILGSYIATAKNQQVADFYPRVGFQPAKKTDEETINFVLNVDAESVINQPYNLKIERN